MLQLQTLGLGRNNISGTLPVEWGQPGFLSKLSVVQLFENQLTGAPAAICVHYLAVLLINHDVVGARR